MNYALFTCKTCITKIRVSDLMLFVSMYKVLGELCVALLIGVVGLGARVEGTV